MDDGALSIRLAALYAGVVYDSLRFDVRPTEPFLLSREIAPVRGQGSDVVIAGRAFTCGGEVVDDSARLDDLHRLRMLSDMTAGCVQVIASGDERSCAHYGDVSAAMAAARGAVAAVVDGNTRDARRLVADGFPMFCRNVTPVDAYGRWQITRHQQDETLAGEQGAVPISSGDWIFADADGVLRIRAGDIDEVLAYAEERHAQERAVRARLDSEDPVALYEELGRW